MVLRARNDMGCHRLRRVWRAMCVVVVVVLVVFVEDGSRQLIAVDLGVVIQEREEVKIKTKRAEHKKAPPSAPDPRCGAQTVTPKRLSWCSARCFTAVQEIASPSIALETTMRK